MMNKDNHTIRVVGISGSLRPGSYSRMALQIALEGAAGEGAQADLVDLSGYQLPFADGRDEAYPADVQDLSRRVKEAQGIILATPEYHGSFSGVLKNALDLMGFEEFEGKMIGLVGVSGGRMGAHSALQSLREIGRALHAWVVPEQAAVSDAWKVFDEKGQVSDEALKKRIQDVGRQVAKFARLHLCDKKAFLESYQDAPANPGG